ncbi:MAG: hypothetical protein A2147_08935 [Chloroflexi bacterium RBG_16_57_8]|nr:MAG: hypothetical protein A2147_08935 [Chloroflexi bacterium RBG_16_57_8]
MLNAPITMVVAFNSLYFVRRFIFDPPCLVFHHPMVLHLRSVDKFRSLMTSVSHGCKTETACVGDFTLPQTLQTKGSTLQFHQCAPVGDVGHFHSPEAKYSFSVTPMGFLEENAILKPPPYDFSSLFRCLGRR